MNSTIRTHSVTDSRVPSVDAASPLAQVLDLNVARRDRNKDVWPLALLVLSSAALAGMFVLQVVLPAASALTGNPSTNWTQGF